MKNYKTKLTKTDMDDKLLETVKAALATRD